MTKEQEFFSRERRALELSDALRNTLDAYKRSQENIMIREELERIIRAQISLLSKLAANARDDE